jgi:hypothetical protein
VGVIGFLCRCFSESEKDALASRVAKLEQSTAEQATMLQAMREALIPQLSCETSASRVAEGFEQSELERPVDPPATSIMSSKGDQSQDSTIESSSLAVPAAACKNVADKDGPHEACSSSSMQALRSVLRAMKRANYAVKFGGRVAKDCERSARTKLRVSNAMQVLKMIAEHETDDANTTSSTTTSTLFASLDDTITADLS